MFSRDAASILPRNVVVSCLSFVGVYIIWHRHTHTHETHHIALSLANDPLNGVHKEKESEH